MFALATLILATPASAASPPPRAEVTAASTGGVLPKTHPRPRPCVSRLRYAIVLRVRATWGHQDYLGHQRSRTARRWTETTGCAYLLWIKRLWSERADEAWDARASLSHPTKAICHVFGAYCSQALSVSWCESRHSTWAENGQYLGLFQMGSSERSIYGHGSTALDQSRAAHRYFVASGRDWSPWSCKP